MLLLRKLHILSLLIPLLMVSQVLPAQRKLKKVRVNHNGSHEVYYVNKGKNKDRQGDYERTTIEGMQIIEAGSYENGEKVGTWHYFFRTMQDPILEQIYDHSLDSMLYICSYDRDYVNEFGPQEIPIIFDSPAIHIGGEEYLYNLIIDQIDLVLHSRSFDEPSYLGSRPNGRVGISFMIGKNGELLLPVVSTNLNSICDELVLEAVKAIDTRWIPANRGGHAIASGKTIFITFSYSESLNYSGPVRQMVFIDRERPAHDKMRIAK